MAEHFQVDSPISLGARQKGGTTWVPSQECALKWEIIRELTMVQNGVPRG